MKKIYIPFFIFVSAISLSFITNTDKSETPTVVIKKEKDRYQLYLNDQPYYIKGAGGYKYYDKLKECGGNSVRLWSTKGAREYLDKAHSLGLTVTLGLDLGHERKGFNYNDKKAVKEQFENIKKDILEFKDHPALIMWGVGNEVDQFANNFNVWNAVNDIAKFIHEVDPKHPTTTMLAGVPVKHIKEIVKRCPDLDLLSINAFKWIAPVRKDLTNAGWTGPYLIGEWGASGYWESETVPWGTFIEETSTQKAEVCAERYKVGISENNDRCLGSYVFYWGWKQARTHTLLSLFSEDGRETGMVDILQKEWTGKERSNRAPLITPVGIDDLATHKGVYIKPSTQHKAYTDSKDPDNDKLYYYWEIYPESTEKKEGGDTEAKPQPMPELIVDGKGKALSFKAPEKEGPYRLFVTVYDEHNHIATANAPFYVKK
ncbi:MAG: glycoside hydrolase family 2 TIM barrel-domain containing protein [Bacteroidota bacterium]